MVKLSQYNNMLVERRHFRDLGGDIRVCAPGEEKNQKEERESAKYVQGREWGTPPCSTDEGGGGGAVLWLHNVTTATLQNIEL